MIVIILNKSSKWLPGIVMSEYRVHGNGKWAKPLPWIYIAKDFFKASTLWNFCLGYFMHDHLPLVACMAHVNKVVYFWYETVWAKKKGGELGGLYAVVVVVVWMTPCWETTRNHTQLCACSLHTTYNNCNQRWCWLPFTEKFYHFFHSYYLYTLSKPIEYE